MIRRIRPLPFIICMVIGINLLLAGCFHYATNHKKMMHGTSLSPDRKYDLAQNETDRPEKSVPQPAFEVHRLDIKVMENRENELVFDISMDDFIESYNSLYFRDKGREYLLPKSEWRKLTYDDAIHSGHETSLLEFTADERIWSQPTITVYVPTNADYIQEITVNFDEHGYSESFYENLKNCAFIH